MVQVQVTYKSYVFSIQPQIIKIWYEEVMFNIVKCFFVVDEAYEDPFLWSWQFCTNVSSHFYIVLYDTKKVF